VRHHDGVGHVRLAGVAHLAFVIAPGEMKGLFELREIVLGAVFANFGFQLAIELFDRIGRGVCRDRIGYRGGFSRHVNLIVAGPS